MKDEKKNKQQDQIVDKQSEESRRRTSTATSQADLTEPQLKREDLPEADQARFKDGVYSGTGTGAGPGGSTDTGGADTTTMEGQARMGTTDRIANKNSEGSSEREGTQKDQQ